MANKFLEENASNVVMEATLRGYDILDCVVEVNCIVENHIEVRRIDDYYDSHKQADGSHEEERRKYRSNLKRHSGMVGFFFTFGDGVRHVIMFKRSWKDFQATQLDNLPLTREDLKNPEITEPLLAEVQKSYKL